MGGNETMLESCRSPAAMGVIPASVWVLLPEPLCCKGPAATCKALPALGPHP